MEPGTGYLLKLNAGTSHLIVSVANIPDLGHIWWISKGLGHLYSTQDWQSLTRYINIPKEMSLNNAELAPFLAKKNSFAWCARPLKHSTIVNATLLNKEQVLEELKKRPPVPIPVQMFREIK